MILFSLYLVPPSIPIVFLDTPISSSVPSSISASDSSSHTFPFNSSVFDSLAHIVEVYNEADEMDDDNLHNEAFVEPNPPPIQLRKSTRVSKPPSYLQSYHCN